MNDTERMIAGKLYMASKVKSPEGKDKSLMRAFNDAPASEADIRTEKYLKKLFGAMGEGAYIEPPFYCDYGWNIFVGKGFYANTGFLVLDQCPVHIGDKVFIGPDVHIYCATHPTSFKVRNTLLEGGKPVTIGDNCWIGGHTTINPGVKIGSGVIIGSGSVVTKDIPDNVVAAGNPCKVIREITEEDDKFWEEEMQEYNDDIDTEVVKY